MSDSAAAENQAWLSMLLDRHESALVRFAAPITRDADRARDVVQDAFIRLLAEGRAAVEGREAEWLYTVVRRRAIDVRRKERRMRPLADAMIATHPCPAAAPDAVIADRLDAGRIEQAMAGLSDNQRDVLRLKFHGGLSYRQIAGVMDLSVGNVGFLIHTALRNIRTQLAEGSDTRAAAERSPS